MIIVTIIKIIRRRKRFIYQNKAPFQIHISYQSEEMVKFWKEQCWFPCALLPFCFLASLIAFLSYYPAGARKSLGKTERKQSKATLKGKGNKNLHPFGQGILGLKRSLPLKNKTDDVLILNLMVQKLKFFTGE